MGWWGDRVGDEFHADLTLEQLLGGVHQVLLSGTVLTEVQHYVIINIYFYVNLFSVLLLHLIVKVQSPGHQGHADPSVQFLVQLQPHWTGIRGHRD